MYVCMNIYCELVNEYSCFNKSVCIYMWMYLYTYFTYANKTVYYANLSQPSHIPHCITSKLSLNAKCSGFKGSVIYFYVPQNLEYWNICSESEWLLICCTGNIEICVVCLTVWLTGFCCTGNIAICVVCLIDWLVLFYWKYCNMCSVYDWLTDALLYWKYCNKYIVSDWRTGVLLYWN